MNLAEIAKEILEYNEERFPGWKWQRVSADKDWTVEDIEWLLNQLMHLHWTASLAGEVGELANAAKKYTRTVLGWTGKKLTYEEYRDFAKEELGDIFIYWLLYCDLLELDPTEVVRESLEKNQERFGEASS